MNSRYRREALTSVARHLCVGRTSFEVVRRTGDAIVLFEL
jgi:hypothetical protein